MDREQKKLIEETTKTIDDFQTGYLEGAMGYKFRTKAFLDVLFLYTNSVDVAQPDILGTTNKNTFIYEVQDEIRKIKEQVRLDLRDLNTMVHGASSLGRFIIKAANRKMLKENTFAVELDSTADNAVDFGSGFLKVWKDGGRKLKMRSIDPFRLIFDQYDFARGMKIEPISTTLREVINNSKYDEHARNLLTLKTQGDKDTLDKWYDVYQVVKPVDSKTNNIYIVDTKNEVVLFTKLNDKDVQYYKFDYEKRRGFPDALGKGANESVFNVIVQSKVNRKRLDEVMSIASKLPLQKQIDNKRDSLVGQEIINLNTGVIVGHKGNPLEPLELGGEKQIAFIRNELNDLTAKAATLLNVGDALQGNTLPSGTSGALGNLLTENASSVHKEVQKAYANFITRVYEDKVTSYLLGVFKNTDHLDRYLDPNDIRIIKENVLDYMTLQAQIDAEIRGETINVPQKRQEIKQKLENTPIISGDLLDKLREEVVGIEMFITTENVSKAQTVAFLRDLRQTYLSNPQAFTSPFFLELIKKEAEYETGLSSLEVETILKELVNQ